MLGHWTGMDGWQALTVHPSRRRQVNACPAVGSASRGDQWLLVETCLGVDRGAARWQRGGPALPVPGWALPLTRRGRTRDGTKRVRASQARLVMQTVRHLQHGASWERADSRSAPARCMLAGQRPGLGQPDIPPRRYRVVGRQAPVPA